MKEQRLRALVKASKERDMLIRMIELFRFNEDYYGRLDFYDKYSREGISTSQKVVCVLRERLKDEEEYLKHLLNKQEDERN